VLQLNMMYASTKTRVEKSLELNKVFEVRDKNELTEVCTSHPPFCTPSSHNPHSTLLAPHIPRLHTNPFQEWLKKKLEFFKA
jgi:hypothetical protein